MRLFSSLLLVFVSLIAACSGSQPAVPDQPTLQPVATLPGTEQSYPVPASNLYPAAGQPAASGKVFPTSTIMPDLGQVEGRIMLNGSPVTNMNVYVSEVLIGDNGIKLAVKYDRMSPINATTDENGRFFIPNIPAGSFGLVFDNGMNAVLLNHPKNGEQMVFEINQGQKIDFGDLDFNELPVP